MEKRQSDDTLNQVLDRTLSHAADLSIIERLAICRHPARPRGRGLVELIASDVIELCGDRCFGDDCAIFGALATLRSGQRCVILANEKGSCTESRLKYRFGMSNPEGYRKAQRLMTLAERFNLPVITLIDTPGANPALEAEERGQGWAISETLLLMHELRVPTIAIIVGEGCSGGALALSVTDRLAMLQHAYFSVISPEGCASILWRDASKRDLAAEALRINAEHLLEFGIVDDVIAEPAEGAHSHPEIVAQALVARLSSWLAELSTMTAETRYAQRAQRYRHFDSSILNTAEVSIGL